MSRTPAYLKDRTALVTGGSSGLGLQIAEALGTQGARVVISARKAHALQSAQAHLAGLGVDASWIAADNASEDKVGRLADEVMERLSKVDILVNNAGATWGATTANHPLSAWDKVMNLNVRAILLLTQQIGKLSMIPNRYCRIINLASIAGLRGNGPTGQPTIAYNTSKGAVVNFTRALAGEWGPYGITVNALAPGLFPSKMTTGERSRRSASRNCRSARPCNASVMTTISRAQPCYSPVTQASTLPARFLPWTAA